MCVPPKGSTHILDLIDIQNVAFYAIVRFQENKFFHPQERKPPS